MAELSDEHPPRFGERATAPLDADDGSQRLGYRHPEYARSLTEFGHPRELPLSGGWLLERAVEGTPFRDAIGPYPLFHCRDWLALPDDLADLRRSGLVSVTLVTAQLPSDSRRVILDRFDLVKPFKTHYVTDLNGPLPVPISRHHRYYARKASREMAWDVVGVAADCLDEWCQLYLGLVKRHDIRGLRAFSREAFRRLLGIPGVIVLRARWQGRTVGAQILLLQEHMAFAHLAAFTQDGYRLGASYLLDWACIEHLRGRADVINWGGGAGPDGDQGGGLARYKQGWASRRIDSYLVGAVLDHRAYQALVDGNPRAPSNYFPSYRTGEFD